MTITPRPARTTLDRRPSRPTKEPWASRRTRGRGTGGWSSPGKLSTWAVTAVLALVFGFLGAFTAVSVFAEDLRGPQGATGVPGPAGRDGASGGDGEDGRDGARGPRGPRGKTAEVAAPTEYGLGTTGCVGQPFRVVTDVRVVDKRVQVDRQLVCVTE